MVAQIYYIPINNRPRSSHRLGSQPSRAPTWDVAWRVSSKWSCTTVCGWKMRAVPAKWMSRPIKSGESRIWWKNSRTRHSVCWQWGEGGWSNMIHIICAKTRLKYARTCYIWTSACVFFTIIRHSFWLSTSGTHRVRVDCCDLENFELWCHKSIPQIYYIHCDSISRVDIIMSCK